MSKMEAEGLVILLVASLILGLLIGMFIGNCGGYTAASSQIREEITTCQSKGLFLNRAVDSTHVLCQHPRTKVLSYHRTQEVR